MFLYKITVASGLVLKVSFNSLFKESGVWGWRWGTSKESVKCVTPPPLGAASLAFHSILVMRYNA